MLNNINEPAESPKLMRDRFEAARNRISENWHENLENISLFHLTVCLKKNPPPTSLWIQNAHIPAVFRNGIKRLLKDDDVKSRLEKVHVDVDEIAYLMLRQSMGYGPRKKFNDFQKAVQWLDKKRNRLGISKKLNGLGSLVNDLKIAKNHYLLMGKNSPKKRWDAYGRVISSIQSLESDIDLILDDLKSTGWENIGPGLKESWKTKNGRRVDLIRRSQIGALANYIAFKSHCSDLSQNVALISKIMVFFDVVISRNNLSRDLKRVWKEEFDVKKTEREWIDQIVEREKAEHKGDKKFDEKSFRENIIISHCCVGI